MKKWKAWTEQEDEVLRQVWKMEGALKWHMDKFPGRTINGVRFRGMKELGLPKRTHLRASKYSWVQEVVEQAFSDGFIGTVQEIADKTTASHQRVREIVKRGHGTKYYISDWKRRTNGCDWTPVWSPGTQQDEPKPEARPTKEISVRYRANKKIKEGKANPFAGLISQVTTGEKISMKPSKGSYGSRVHYMDEAA